MDFRQVGKNIISAGKLVNIGVQIDTEIYWLQPLTFSFPLDASVDNQHQRCLCKWQR